MGHDHRHEQQSIGDGRHDEEIGGSFPSSPWILGAPHSGSAEVLDSETRFVAAQLALAQAEFREPQSLVEIYRSLGGGWQE